MGREEGRVGGVAVLGSVAGMVELSGPAVTRNVWHSGSSSPLFL